jgi:predicted nucleic acid-binding protein
MAAGKPKICWDSCVYISLLTGENRTPAEMKCLYEVENLANQGRAVIFASVITLVEVLECKLTPEQAAKFQGLVANPDTPFMQVDTKVAALAHEIRSYYEGRVSTPDAIHLATAIHFEATALQTYDGCRKKKHHDLLMLDQPIAGKYMIPITIPQIPQLEVEAEAEVPPMFAATAGQETEKAE